MALWKKKEKSVRRPMLPSALLLYIYVYADMAAII